MPKARRTENDKDGISAPPVALDVVSQVVRSRDHVIARDVWDSRVGW